jgi:hypothetical protein
VINSALTPLLLVLFLLVGLWLYILLAARMANDRNRNAVIWVLISLVGSPVLAILLLIALGTKPTPQRY